MNQVAVKETAPGRNSGKVIELQDYVMQKKDYILHELLAAVPEEYRKDYSESPLLRLLLKYDGMNKENKERIFNFAEKVIAEKRGEQFNKRDIFSHVLAWGNNDTWGTIEKVADNLLIQDRG